MHRQMGLLAGSRFPNFFDILEIGARKLQPHILRYHKRVVKFLTPHGMRGSL